MTPTPSDDPMIPATSDELLARARRRGEQFRRRRRATVGGGALAVVALAIALPLSLAAGGSGARLVQVATSSTTSVPSASSGVVNGQYPGFSYSPTTPEQTSPTNAPTPKPVGVTPSSATPTTARPTPTTPPGAHGTVTVTDSNNGQTVYLAIGATLVVQLHASNWVIGPSSQPAVLAMEGPPVQQRTQPCPMGVSCGTTTATYGAKEPGQAQVTATRPSCGEVIQCTPTNPDTWSITVVVTQ